MDVVGANRNPADRILDQHFRLLHVVRNPRVGDRIDTDLPAYLDDALPQLSEAALDDAAQPLEDLDEHRRNVHDLTRTADTLDALTSVYQSYAANEIRSRAKHVLELADQVAICQRTERRCRREADAAALSLREIRNRIAALKIAADRLREEIAALDVDSARSALGAIRADSHQRRLDIEAVGAAIDQIDRRTDELSRAERERDRTGAAISVAEDRLRDARIHLDDELASWRESLRSWNARLDVLDAGLTRTGVADSLVDVVDLLDRRREVIDAYTAAIDRLADHHRSALAVIAPRHDSEQTEIGDLVAALQELRQRTYPEPPATSWQRAERRTRLADFVNFTTSMADTDRAGLEAAMEASGLLGAEISADGMLQLDSGELVVVADEPAEHPLSRLLVATVPEARQPGVDPGMIEKILSTRSPPPQLVVQDRRRRRWDLPGRSAVGTPPKSRRRTHRRHRPSRRHRTSTG